MSGGEKGKKVTDNCLEEPGMMMGYLCVVWPKAIPVPPGSLRIASYSRTLWWSPSLPHSSLHCHCLQEALRRLAAIP